MLVSDANPMLLSTGSCLSIDKKMESLLEASRILAVTRKWVESFVVDLNLCPFAKKELAGNRVRFVVSTADSGELLLTDLQAELELLGGDQRIETTLLIHPDVLQKFVEYNQFLDYADALIEQMTLTGTYQIASFHPDYQFDGTDPMAAENCTNRSPYPMLHLLREKSLEQAIASYPDIEQIPRRNIALMQKLGKEELLKIRKQCLN